MDMKGYFAQIIISFLLVGLMFASAFSIGGELDYDFRQVSASETGTVLILDAGHGGTDGGAVSITGKTESEINLEITLKAAQLANFMGIEPVLTRSDEDIQYPEQADTIRKKKVYDQKTRVELINSTPNAVLISIHQNKFQTSRAWGGQVFYANRGDSFAAEVQSKLNEVLYPDSKRTAEKISDSIYLMKNITCPAVLIECGFLSNPEEAKLLETEEYQKKLAVVIIGEFLHTYG